jgi:hypothetical protein
MVYIGDSFTDIPAMSVLIAQGGHAIGVYHPGDDPHVVKDLLQHDRINFFAEADYREGTMLEQYVLKILDQIKAQEALRILGQEQREQVW